jgi:hypothetical protein
MRSRSVLVLVVACLVPFAAGCGSSDAALDMGSPDTGSDLGALDAAPPDLDMGATDGGDGGASNDAAPPDLDMGATDGGDGGSALDAGHDAGEPDAGLPVVQVCQACILDEQCPLDADCLDFGPNRLCFIRVQDEFSACPRTFEAAQLASSPGLFHCLPTEGCCIDEDDDNHGQGVFCVGPDCDDDDDFVYPGADELCDGEDNDCDGVEDDMAVDCDPADQCVQGTCEPVAPG